MKKKLMCKCNGKKVKQKKPPFNDGLKTKWFWKIGL